MTVSSTTDRAAFLGNGVTTVFPLPFRFFENSDVQVWLVTNATGVLTPLSIGANYTLSGAGDPEVSGSATSELTMATPPTSAQSLFVMRKLPLTQPTDIVNQGAFFPEIHEKVFDRLTMLIQQAIGDNNGAIRVAIGDPEPARLPNAVSRALLLMGFDDDGNPVAVAPISGSAADLAMNLLSATDPAKGSGQVGFDKETPYSYGVGLALKDLFYSSHRDLSHLPMLGYNFQFGSSDEHFLSKNAVVILGDSITQGANTGNYIEDGWAHKVKRALMDAYRSTSYGYLGMALKPGFIDAPSGAYRWYQITTNGIARENEDAPNSMGGGEIGLSGAQFITVQFNRTNQYGSQIVPNQRRYRISFNDSSGSVRVTASGIGFTIDEVVPTVGTGVSDLLSLPQSWDGTITLTAESGAPVINGVVFMSSDTDYGVHLLYNGGLALTEMSDGAITRAIDKSDLYVHALGVNDGFSSIQSEYEAKVEHVIATLAATRKTRCLVMDFGWNQSRTKFSRVGLRKINNDVPNESRLIDIPAILANGGTEFSAAQLNDPSILFLSSDEVHPFINGHNMIASLVLAELGISRNVPYMLTGSERRRPILEASRSFGYTFQPRELASVITGWSASGGQSIAFTEAGGCIATGFISLAYIETMIPVVDGMQYVITLDVENINSTGTLSLGTRSLDLLGNEIWQQDSIGGLSGNIQIIGLPAIGSRQTYKLLVGGSNAVGGADPAKFEPGARFFNVAMVMNNGDPAGQLRLHGLSVTPGGADFSSVTQVVTFSNSWASSGGLFGKRSPESVVRLVGTLQNPGTPASGSNMMTMPVGYRPAAQLEIPVIDGNGVAARLRFEAGGVVRLYGTVAANWGNLNLNGVFFSV